MDDSEGDWFALAGGHADFRDYGAADRPPWRQHAGYALFARARWITADRNGSDVRVDERLPPGALAEAAVSLTMWRSKRTLSGSRTSRVELRLQLPGLAVIARELAKPTECVRCHVGEAPAQRHTSVVLSDLHDVAILSAAELTRVELLQRVAPKDVPGSEPGIVDAQGRAVEDAG